MSLATRARTRPAPLHRVRADTAAAASLAATGGLLSLLVAQGQLESRRLSLVAVGMLALGASAWIGSLRLAPPRTVSISGPDSGGGARLPALAGAVALGAVAWFEAGGGEYTVLGVTTWLGALAAWCWAWWPRAERARPPWSGAARRAIARWPSLATLGLIVVAAGVFRFYGLGELPLDPTSDHAEKLLDVSDVLGGSHPIFFERNTGREPGQFYVTAAMIEVFGLPLDFTTLKLGTAAVGVLAVPAVYLFAAELGGRVAGLTAAALMAVSAWPLGIDRAGLRFPYASFAAVLSLWLLLRYVRTGDRRAVVGAGVAVGVGLHGYTAFRVVVLVVPIAVAIALAAPRLVGGTARRPGRSIADGLLVLATAVVTCLPLARYTADHPRTVFARVESRAIGENGLGSSVAQLLENTWGALLAFNWRGPDIQVNALRFEPLLDVVSGAALLAGVLVLGARLVRRDPAALFVALAVPVLMLSSTLNIAFPLENPSPSRLAPVMPVVFALPGLAVAQLWPSRRLASTPRGRMLAASAALALLAVALPAAAAQNADRFFDRFRAQYDAWVPNTDEVVGAVEDASFGPHETYVAAWPHWLDGRNVGLELGDVHWSLSHQVEPGEALPPLPAGSALLFIVHNQDTAFRQRLENRYSRPSATFVRSRIQGRDFVLVRVG